MIASFAVFIFVFIIYFLNVRVKKRMYQNSNILKSDRLKIHHDGKKDKDTGVTAVSLFDFLKN